ncbi:hypothetical protein C6N75_04565 [Streptomyces solincola]|uniref:Major facilitator superfamily (MFS) profile domain-containing protein n=1 Tax=Streptomyces solincola TaxID=2100817 RepID=A0A2S9Q130_9ACTN|nr:MFS transporter [Streptomyces solincola]PRH80366.1 hypothetical protein C6N75_04565 [Streptomyces solincola]
MIVRRKPRSDAFSRREKLLLAGAGSACLVDQADWFAVSLALPQIARDFDTPLTDLHWVLSAFLIAFGSTLASAGWLADRFGRRRMTLVGLGLFSAASLCAGVAPGVAWLVIGRVGQGAAGALIIPAALAMITNSFERDRADRAVAKVVGTGALGTAVGPAVGGLLAGTAGWRWVFLVNIPVLAFAFVAVLVSGEETRAHAVPHKPAFGRMLLVGLGVCALSFAVDRGADWGWSSPRLLLLWAVAAICFLWFAVRERRAAEPLYGPVIYRNRRLLAVVVSGALAATSFAFVALFGTMYLENARGYSSIQVGCVFLACAGAMAVAAYQADRAEAGGRGLRRLVVGAVVAGAAVAVTTADLPLVGYVPPLVVYGLGVGLANGITILITQTCVPQQAAGRAAAFRLAARSLLGAASLSLGNTVLEVLNHGARGASRNAHALDVMLWAAAALMLLSAAATLIAPRARRSQSSGGK